MLYYYNSLVLIYVLNYRNNKLPNPLQTNLGINKACQYINKPEQQQQQQQGQQQQEQE